MEPSPDYVLDRPAEEDLDELFAIESDPRVWTHLPSGRMTAREEAEAIIVKLQSQWELDGLGPWMRSEEHTSELQSRGHLVCRLLLEKKNKNNNDHTSAYKRQ